MYERSAGRGFGPISGRGESELLKLVDGFSCCGETKWIGVPWCGAGARGRSGCCSGRASASRIITGKLGEHGLRLESERSTSAPQTHGWTSHLLRLGVTRVVVVLCLSEDTVIRSEPVRAACMSRYAAQLLKNLWSRKLILHFSTLLLINNNNFFAFDQSDPGYLCFSLGVCAALSFVNTILFLCDFLLEAFVAADSPLSFPDWAFSSKPK